MQVVENTEMRASYWREVHADHQGGSTLLQYRPEETAQDGRG